MEVERRHGEPKNDLDMLLRVKAPEFFQKHAANVLLGLLLLASIGYFFYQQRRNHQLENEAKNQNTAIAYSSAIQLRDLVTRVDLSDEGARDRQELATQVFTAADLVLNSEADATQKAAAQLAKAEALWSLGCAPTQSLTTTQPIAGFAPRSQSDYLTEAKAAYFDILQKYPEQKEIAANALLSIAAICESTSKFDEAQEWYNKVVKDPSLRSIYHDVAKGRIAKLDDLRKPFTLSPTTQPTTLPSTQPTMAAPSTAPTTSPAVQ